MKRPRRGGSSNGGAGADLYGRDRLSNSHAKFQKKTEMTSGTLSAELVDVGWIFAAWDAATHDVEGRVEQSRFGARLHPFRSRDDAARALEGAGAAGDG